MGKLQLAKVKMLSRTAFLFSYIVYTFKEIVMEFKLHYDYNAEKEGTENFWEEVDYWNHSRQLACFIIVLVSLYLTNRQNCHMWGFIVAFIALTAQQSFESRNQLTSQVSLLHWNIMQIVMFIIYAPIFELSLFAMPIIVANWCLRTIFYVPAPY